MQRRLFVVLLIFFSYWFSARAQDDITLTTPKPSISGYRLSQLVVTWGGADESRCRIQITLEPNVINAEAFIYLYRGAEACTMITQLNTANLTTISLRQRLLQRLVADKVLEGTVTGAP